METDIFISPKELSWDKEGHSTSWVLEALEVIERILLRRTDPILVKEDLEEENELSPKID
jgi:hypothetical protein